MSTPSENAEQQQEIRAIVLAAVAEVEAFIGALVVPPDAGIEGTIKVGIEMIRYAIEKSGTKTGPEAAGAVLLMKARARA